MARYADQFGHYVFAPGSLQHAVPCIDRLQLAYRNIDLSFVPVDRWSTFMDALARHSRVFRRGQNRSLTTRASWLFQAELSRDEPSERRNGGCRAKLQLTLNPTRILQALGGSIEPQRLDRLLSEPASVLFAPKGMSAGLRAAREITFNGADNFITEDVARLPTLGPAFAQRAVIIARAIRTLIMQDMARVLREEELLSRVSARSIGGAFETARWSVGQCEFYWEFRTANAVERMHLRDRGHALKRVASNAY